MVNKLLIGAGIVALIAVGSIGVLKVTDSDDRRAGALGPIAEPISLSWRGSWTRDAKYQAGQVVSHKGSSYVAEAANGGVTPGAADGPWALMAAQGIQGPTGTFSGTFQSPDGNYTLSVSNAGIEASGPDGRVRITPSGVEVKSSTVLLIDAAGSLEAKASGPASFRGSLTRLGCAGGGTPTARQNDTVTGVVTGDFGGPLQNGRIASGSPTVFAC